MHNLALEWTPKDGVQYDDDILNIIKCNLNTAILAGPGAGKTELLAQKACFLLETGVVAPPRNILSISRKKESASNIKSRVELRCGKKLSIRFHSFTIEAFTKSLLDRFFSILPENEQPDRNYTLEAKEKAIFPSSLSFDQITKLANRIITISPVLTRVIRATYSHVFIDEFQDLNDHQYAFILSLFGSSSGVITVVGDTKQAIMKFANALPDVFIKFEKDFSSKLCVLNSNHRSTPELKNFLHRLSNKWWPTDTSTTTFTGDQYSALAPEQFTMCCYQDENHEAESISNKIYQWIYECDIPPHEIAVLIRANAGNNYSRTLMQYLYNKKIMSINESNLQDHLSEPLGKIILCLLVLSTRERDSEYWEKLQDLYLTVNDNNNYGHAFELGRVANYINLNRFLDDTATIETIYESVIQFIHLFFSKKIGDVWPQYNQGDLAKKTINGIIEELREVKQKGLSWRTSVDILSGTNAVRIMTIHKSKGLEFEAVILLGFEDYSFFRFGATDKKIDEERSTIFVALSRAKTRFLISAAKYRKHMGSAKFSGMRTIIDDLESCGLVKKNILADNRK